MLYTDSYGATTQGSVSLDNIRRKFDFGDRVANISPMDSAFMYFLLKLAKVPTSDPVFKMLEQRHQYQRGDFNVAADQAASVAVSGGSIANITITVECTYDIYGRKHRDGTTFAPQFFKIGDDIVIKTTTGYTPNAGSPSAAHLHFHVVGVTNGTTAASQTTSLVLALYAINGSTTFTNGDAIDLNNNDVGQLAGNAFAEGSGAPDSWSDKLYDREGYTQIFKTACPMFTGSALATELRGFRDEFKRIWAEKAKEHKMQKAHASLFGVGHKGTEDGSNPARRTWGVIPYIETAGGYVDKTFTYASSSYDTFLNLLLNYLEPEGGVAQGTKVAFCSRKIMKWLNQLGSSGFLMNTVGSNHTSNIDIFPNQVDEFGFKLTQISTVFGDINFYTEALLRGPWEDYCVIVDFSCVRWRPLVGNGYNRDTAIYTNIQNNDEDARKDLIMTEAGLQIDLPEKHCLIGFS